MKRSWKLLGLVVCCVFILGAGKPDQGLSLYQKIALYQRIFDRHDLEAGRALYAQLMEQAANQVYPEVEQLTWVDPLPGINFSAFTSATFDRLEGGSVIFEPLGGTLRVRTVDQAIHADVLGEYAVEIDGPVRFAFSGPDCWGDTVYLGSDVYDANRLPVMFCFADVDGTPEYVGGDYSWTPFGPQSEGWPAFQYLLCHVYRTPFPGYTPRPLLYCDVFPDGDDVFVALVQTLEE